MRSRRGHRLWPLPPPSPGGNMRASPPPRTGRWRDGSAMAELTLDGKLGRARVARRFARISLAGAADELTNDVELVGAELVTNAALHAQPPVVINISASPGR